MLLWRFPDVPVLLGGQTSEMTIFCIYDIVGTAHALERRSGMAANKGPTPIDETLVRFGRLVSKRAAKKARRQRAREPDSPVNSESEYIKQVLAEARRRTGDDS